MSPARRFESESRCTLWLTEFDSPLSAAWIEQQLKSFTASEVRRLARIRRTLRREQFVVGHVLLRRVLVSLGVADPIIDVVAPDGRPHFAAPHAAAPLSAPPRYVSISHSQGKVAALVSPQAAGVDIEVKRTLRDPAGAAAMLGNSQSSLAAELSASDDPSELALKLWVTAEARAKARHAESHSASSMTWLSSWNSCWIAVAGTANSPATFVSDLLRETYNSAQQDWVAAPCLKVP